MGPSGPALEFRVRLGAHEEGVGVGGVFHDSTRWPSGDVPENLRRSRDLVAIEVVHLVAMPVPL